MFLKKKNIKILKDELRESQQTKKTKAMEWKPVCLDFFVNFISFFIQKPKKDRSNNEQKLPWEWSSLYCAHTHAHNRIFRQNLLGIILILCFEIKTILYLKVFFFRCHSVFLSFFPSFYISLSLSITVLRCFSVCSFSQVLLKFL